MLIEPGKYTVEIEDNTLFIEQLRYKQEIGTEVQYTNIIKTYPLTFSDPNSIETVINALRVLQYRMLKNDQN
jgi:hypothetical protein